MSYTKACALQFNSMEHLLSLIINYFIIHHFKIGPGLGKKLLIHSMKSTFEQTDQEEYEENEKEYIFTLDVSPCSCFHSHYKESCP